MTATVPPRGPTTSTDPSTAVGAGGWTRFAPAPTGYLHLGHVAFAIWVWGLGAATGSRVLLRIEDHDRLRSRPEYLAAILEDLASLGFVADAGPAIPPSATCEWPGKGRSWRATWPASSP